LKEHKELIELELATPEELWDQRVQSNITNNICSLNHLGVEPAGVGSALTFGVVVGGVISSAIIFGMTGWRRGKGTTSTAMKQSLMWFAGITPLESQ
jgi:hypothetical protein